ncbi:MaoC family dehydratase [Bosea sp. (in: a-proteobacteria)]|jgi:acyl dehydratase|uniref:MaoC family dehydratase n=1 Tax=Bosea sp. (in: a-proteobacteria) TaxID=1871050 RepID=UPI003F7214C0
MSQAFSQGELLPERLVAAKTAAHVRDYARLSGDDNPLHLDDGIAIAAGLPGRPLHGMMLMAWVEPLVAAWRPDVFIAEAELRFMRPALVEQPLRLSGKVAKVTSPSGDEATVRVLFRDLSGAVLALGHTRLVRPPPASASAAASPFAGSR